MNNKIAFICPYFGAFRDYFPFFERSCEVNSTIDFYFFTDINKEDKKNVFFIPMSFEEVRERAQKLFDFKISLNTPYKLCDFKPVYGLMFADYIKDYDYWGHCDTDMILGDIRHFFTDNILKKYDRFQINGMFSMYRNVNSVNNVFRESPYCKVALGNEPIMKFDEGGDTGTGIYWIRNLRERLYLNFDIFSDPKTLKKTFKCRFKEDTGNSLVSYDVANGKVFKRYVESGILKERELLYVHFYKRKLKSKIPSDAASYSIVPNAFVPPLNTPKGGRLSFFDFLYRAYYCWHPIYLSKWFERLKTKIFKI